MTTQVERELSHPPPDGITASKFAHLSDLLVVSSWDKGVRLYDVTKDVLLLTYEHKGSVLDCCFSDDDSKLFSAGIDRNIIMMDVKTERQTTLGSHDQPIKCVEWHNSSGLIVTGSWDSSISLWDYKSRKPNISSINNNNAKVYTLSSAEDKIVVGTSNRHVFVYDVRNMSSPLQHRESPLMNQTRCIRCFPDGTGFALSSIEGRVAIEYFDSSPQIQKKRYAFKCHRKTVGKTQLLYPVNAIAFHPTYGTFATGGSDGQINIWDGANQKRIFQYPHYPTSIAYLDFNRNGNLLAIASSYTFEEGEKDHPPDAIFIRTVNDSEVKLKAIKK